MDLEQLKNNMQEFSEQVIKYRTTTYIGKGRPKKSDYVFLKRTELRDYRAFEMLNNGFTTNYT